MLYIYCPVCGYEAHQCHWWNTSLSVIPFEFDNSPIYVAKCPRCHDENNKEYSLMRLTVQSGQRINEEPFKRKLMNQLNLLKLKQKRRKGLMKRW